MRFSINKLQGFFELSKLNLPCVKWQIFDKGIVLDASRLWTVRVAMQSGDDFNLPRLVGAKAQEAMATANKLLLKYGNNAIVIYYPYFVAVKSGTLAIEANQIIIEATYGDLWHLVNENRLDARLVFRNGSLMDATNKSFFSAVEVEELKKSAQTIEYKLYQILSAKQMVIAEWSFAEDSDVNGQPVGNQYLVFYELRSV